MCTLIYTQSQSDKMSAIIKGHSLVLVQSTETTSAAAALIE